MKQNKCNVVFNFLLIKCVLRNESRNSLNGKSSDPALAGRLPEAGDAYEKNLPGPNSV